MHPLERLINLVALLLESRRPLTFEDIRAVMPAYQQTEPSSAKRMFERDKDTLREAGIPVELAPTDAWEVDHGYTISKEQYYLPEIQLDQDEAWALFVAARTPGDGAEAEQAFHKLSAGMGTEALSSMVQRAPLPGADLPAPYLGPVADALARRRRIRFKYRAPQGAVTTRQADPYSLVFRRGNWYLVGLDMGRGEIRSYRLSRIVSQIAETDAASGPPEGFDALSYLEAGPWGLGEPELRARVSFSPKVAWMILSSIPEATLVGSGRNGWVEMEVPASGTDSFVSWVLSFGVDARVRSPQQVREQVVAKLRALAAGG